MATFGLRYFAQLRSNYKGVFWRVEIAERDYSGPSEEMEFARMWANDPNPGERGFLQRRDLQSFSRAPPRAGREKAREAWLIPYEAKETSL